MMNRAQTGSVAALAMAAGLMSSAASGQFYTFTSGPAGDGIVWPASPQGLLSSSDTSNFNEFAFSTPDGIEFQNYTGNNAFFDSQYQVASNSGLISGDALWGNPTFDDFGSIDIFTNPSGFGGVQSVEFDYAQAVAGGTTPDFLDITVQDSDGRVSFQSFFLGNSFSGFGGFDGYADTITLDAFDLSDDTGEFEGDDQFIDIDFFYIDLNSIASGGGTSEYAIDNFSVDGSSGNGGDGEVFPSVNGGAFDVTGSTNSTNWLRGTGDAGIGLEVTNDSGDNTTYSIQLNPGGDLSSGATVFGDTILDGESVFTANVAVVDRSLPAGEYSNDVTTINNGDPSDPDNVSTLSIDLLDAPLLSGPGGTVDVSAGQEPVLANAAGPFRASIKLVDDSTTLTGPFRLLGGWDDERVLPGDSATINVGIDRYGVLSGLQTGTMTTSVEMTHYIVNEFVDFESFLGGAEAVPDQTWNLTHNLVDVNSDSQNIGGGTALRHTVGVNSADVAATFIDGTVTGTQTISMNFVGSPGDDASASILGQAVDVNFGGSITPYVLQFSYDDLNATLIETGLALLAYDTGEAEWVNAVDLNAGGTADFFNGSYEDFMTANPGSVASNLGAYGIDNGLNHVWAVIDFEGAFAAGLLGGTSPLDGDYNGDGFVSQADLDLVLLNWGETTVPAEWVTIDQFDGIQVSQNELDGVLLNWGNGTPPTASAIPEPTTAALLGGLGLLASRRRRAANP